MYLIIDEKQYFLYHMLYAPANVMPSEGKDGQTLGILMESPPWAMVDFF